MIKLVLFDIDGTLIYTCGAGQHAFGRVFTAEFGVANAAERVSFAGRTDPAIVREVFLQHDIDPVAENFQRFWSNYVFWLDHFLTQLPGRVHGGVWELLHDLRRLSMPPVIGLLTGNIRLGAEIKLRRFDLWDEFVMGGFGDDDENRNHIAAIAQRRGVAMLGKKLRGEEILVIGDTPLDIQCARAIEAKVLAVATGGSTLEQLQCHQPDWAVASLEEVTAREICG